MGADRRKEREPNRRLVCVKNNITPLFATSAANEKKKKIIKNTQYKATESNIGLNMHIKSELHITSVPCS